jgi:ribosomal protein S8
MIDGTKSVEVFNNFSEVLGDVTAMLAVLEEQGFIQKHQVVEKPNQATERALGKNTEKIPDEGQEKTQPIKDTVDTSLFNIS